MRTAQQELADERRTVQVLEGKLMQYLEGPLSYRQEKEDLRAKNCEALLQFLATRYNMSGDADGESK